MYAQIYECLSHGFKKLYTVKMFKQDKELVEAFNTIVEQVPFFGLDKGDEYKGYCWLTLAEKHRDVAALYAWEVAKIVVFAVDEIRSDEQGKLVLQHAFNKMKEMVMTFPDLYAKYPEKWTLPVKRK